MVLEKLLVTVSVSGGVLLVLEGLGSLISKRTLHRYSESGEKPFVASFLVNFVFLVLLSSVIYAELYPILPFTSYRAGLFIALFLFGVAAFPLHLRYYYQFRLPVVVVAFQVFWNLLTLLVVFGLITLLYRY